MRRFGLASLVISNLLLLSMALGASRPHYGGTLRIATKSSPKSLDPLQQNNSLAENNLGRLLFDTLTETDPRGAVQPSLATSWNAEPGNQRWQLKLRNDVTFADGSPLSTDAVASSLRDSNPEWKVFPASDSIIIETETPNPELPAELALSKNLIVKRSGNPLGTGPFAVAEWQPGKNLVLKARESYWRGRPFTDSIQFSFGLSLREQMILLQLGKADIVELAPEQAHRLGIADRQVSPTEPIELLTLVFAREPVGTEDDALRRALALSIDRASINNVLLQGAGVPAGSLLPDWMSGYSFLFASAFDLPQARQLRNQIRQIPTWTLGYDMNDSLGRVIAERIALNARDAGIIIQTSSGTATDIRLARVRIDSLAARVALNREAQGLGVPAPVNSGNSAEDKFAAESSLLRTGRLIPLLHVRAAYGVSTKVNDWNTGPDGSWRLGDVWIGADTN